MLKLSLSLLLTAICALFGLGLLLDQLADDNSASPIAALERRVMQQVVTQLAAAPTTTWQGSVNQAASEWQLPLQLRVRSELALPTELTAQLTNEEGLLLNNGEQLLLYRAVAEDGRYLLQLELTDTAAPQPNDLWLTLSLYGGFCLSMWLWAWPLMRRLWLLHQTARRFGQGDLTARLAASRFSYIPQLEAAFNQMAQRIEQLLSDNKLLSQSLSHDLRTPIACLRFGLEAAQEETEATHKDRYLQRMEADLSRMEAMISAVLQYASLDRQRWHSHLTKVDLVALLQQQLLQAQPLADERRITLVVNLPQLSQVTLGHAHWLHCAVQNLLQNALRYARSEVQIALIATSHTLRVTISDDGPGIAQADAERIFDPFVQLAERNAQHFGLGLAIVRKVVEWHEGQIRVTRFAPAGAVFELTLPSQPQL